MTSKINDIVLKLARTSINKSEYGQPILNALKKMLTLPYYKNSAASSGDNIAKHENAVANVLKEFGFFQINKPSKTKNDDIIRWLKNPELSQIPDGSFIEQPCGHNNSPDFVIKVNNKFVLFLEAKSSASSYTPVYNSGGVKPNYVYVFCSKITNETTIYKGSSIITQQQQEIINKRIDKARFDDEESNKELNNIDENHRGISFYTRPMITQKGGSTFSNYFTHDQRTNAENKALKWIHEMCHS